MNIYVTGPTKDTNLFEIYKAIKDTFSKLGYNVKTPLDTIEFAKTHNDKERFERAMREINGADIVIFEVSSPSSGGGFELGVLFANGAKNVILISNGASVSGILIGAYGNPLVYSNETLPKLLDELKVKLNKYKNR